jgi:hypothetical protein
MQNAPSQTRDIRHCVLRGPVRASLAGAVLSIALSSVTYGQGGPVAGRIPDLAGSAASPVRPTPRLPNGRPDLGNAKGAWNPRVIANLAGVGDPNRSPVERRVDVPFQPWAKAVYEDRQANLQKHDPESRCLPPGIPRMMATPFPFQIFQLSDRVLFIFEGGAHVWRTIYTDGRPHQPDPNPTFLGDSVGHWEGDTLVVDTINFKRETSFPNSSANLHLVEKFTRTDADTLMYEFTVDDPSVWTRPFTAVVPMRKSDQPIYEYACHEGNYAMASILAGARAAEKAAEAKAPK